MAKVQFNCRIPEEISVLINSESERLTAEQGKKVSQADVVGLAIVKWCSGYQVPIVTLPPDEQSLQDTRREIAETALRMAEAQGRIATLPAAPEKKAKAESVAERKAREAREHAAALAESDVVAREAGRDDIEYDLENAVHRSAVAIQPAIQSERRHYDVAPRKVKALARPCGSVEAKRRRDQA